MAVKSIPNPSFDAVIFDLDGTIVDTEPTSAEVLKKWFGAQGAEVTADDARMVAGRRIESVLGILFQKYNLEIPVDRALREIGEEYRKMLDRGLISVPGVEDAIRLFAQSYPMAIVSGSTRSEIQWVIERLKISHLFQFILGAEDYRRSKPAPDGYLKGAEIFGMPEDRILVFEDSFPGVAAAHAAGMKVIAIDRTNHFQHDTSGADLHIKDFLEVDENWIKSLKI